MVKQKLEVTEQFSPIWKTAFYLSIAIAVLFFIIFLLTSDPLWKGIFRFIAFIGFVGAVFSFLRLREGQKRVQIEFSEENLIVTYFKKDEMLKEELFERKTIKEIYKKEAKSAGNLLGTAKGYAFFITFTDTDKTLPFFEYSGRNLSFKKEAALKINHFLTARTDG